VARSYAHDHHDHGSAHSPAVGMMSVEDARERILSSLEPLSPIGLPLQEAFGCVLAEEVVAQTHMPDFSSSAMDGYAVRADDIAGASRESPVELQVVGRARIGRRPDSTVGSGEAMRIDTGAPIPAGADCIVPVEQADGGGARVRIFAEMVAGRHIRPFGEDARSGDVLVPAGRRLGAPELGLLAASGHAQVAAHPRPRVVVVSTGDELVEPGQSAGFGQVRDANAYTLFGQVREVGAAPYVAGIVQDDVERLRDTMLSHLITADVYVTSGGVSMGDRDVVKRAFLRRGEIDFFRVAMQPGMPQAFGALEGKPFFGLPGNPVSVFISFEVFVRPALLKMMGRSDLHRPEVNARLVNEITGPKEKLQFARVRVRRGEDGWVAESTGPSGSNLLSTVARSNGLAMIPPGVDRAPAGSDVRVMLFRSLEG
jgi:molybdopterin molybdotransferase